MESLVLSVSMISDIGLAWDASLALTLLVTVVLNSVNNMNIFIATATEQTARMEILQTWPGAFAFSVCVLAGAWVLVTLFKYL